MFNNLLRGTEIARVLNISKAYAYRLIAEGQIPAVRFGRTVRVRQEDLDQFIEKNLRIDQVGSNPHIMPI